MLSNFLIILVFNEKTKLKLVLAILAGARITLVKELINTLPLAAEKTIKILSM